MVSLIIILHFISIVLATQPLLKGATPMVERICALDPKGTQNLVSVYEGFLSQALATYPEINPEHHANLVEIPELWMLLQKANPELTTQQEELKKLEISSNCKVWLGISYNGDEGQFKGGLFELFLRVLPIQRFDLLSVTWSGLLHVMSELRRMNYYQQYFGIAKDELLAEMYLNYITLFNALNERLMGGIVNSAHATGTFGLLQKFSSVSVYTLDLQLFFNIRGFLSSYINHERDTITNRRNEKCYLIRTCPYSLAFRLWKFMDVVSYDKKKYLGRDLDESVKKLERLSANLGNRPKSMEIWNLLLAFDFIESIAIRNWLYFKELTKVRKRLTEVGPIISPR